MNKNYLVVGGTSGVGAAILDRLISKGDNVAQLSRNPDGAADMPGVTSAHWDVRSEAFPTQVLPEVLDGMIYCPGTIRLKPVDRLRENEWQEDMEVNLFGAFKSIQACLPRLKKSEGANILLFSTVAVRVGMAYHASIASAKGAVEGLVRSLAAEFAPKIRVNALALSVTDTPLAERLLNSDEKRSLAEARHPLKRIGSTHDVAAAAEWLLDAPWVTGQVIAVDGGLSSARIF